MVLGSDLPDALFVRLCKGFDSNQMQIPEELGENV